MWKDRAFWGRMFLIALLGFSSGLPFLIIKDVLKAWLTDQGLDIATIGLFSAVSLPSTFKFLWSPIIDRYSIPVLGRRRGWMLIAQVGLMMTIYALGQMNPQEQLYQMAMMALAIAFFSASQDIAIDAFRRELLPATELGLGTGIYSNTFRLANLASVGIAFALADKIGYSDVFLILASMMLVGVVAVFLSPEPKTEHAPPKTLREAVIGPFQEFFSRKGAWTILAFFLLYKIGDNMASAMNVPYILKMGYTKEQYFLIVKGVGMAALFLGMLAGGAFVTRFGLRLSLWLFGILQMLSTACFALLSFFEHSQPLLIGIVVFELLSTGLGTTAYATYMALQTNTRFTATQYALMTSLMAVPLTVAASITGFMVKFLDWPAFYFICALVAIPGLWLLVRLKPQNVQVST